MTTTPTSRATPRRFRALSTALAAAVALVPTAARAQANALTTTFAVDRLFMAGAPGDGFAVWRPDVAATTRFFAQVGLGVAVNPLPVDNYVDNLNHADKLKGNPLTTQFITYLNAGVEIGGRVSLQVAFPLVGYQTGNPTNSTQCYPATGQCSTVLPQRSVELDHVAAGDLRLEARVVVYRTESRAFQLALSAAGYFPTGNKLSFAGDNGFGASVGLAAEYDVGPAALTFNAAYRYRPTVTLNELTVSSEVVYALAAYVPLRKGAVVMGVEFFGGFGAGPQKGAAIPPLPARTNVGDLDTTPLEWMLNGKMYFTAKRHLYAGIGAGTRLTGGYAPDFRAVGVVGGSFSPYPAGSPR